MSDVAVVRRGLQQDSGRCIEDYEGTLAALDRIEARLAESERGRIEAMEGQREQLQERMILEARLQEAERDSYAGALGRKWMERACLAEERAEAAEEREAALREALQEAKTTIRQAQMRYEHPLVEHQAICDCVSCEGITRINAALAAEEHLPNEGGVNEPRCVRGRARITATGRVKGWWS